MENILNVTGRIFDIQRFSIHDGPGIRTVIFFKGCALRCPWCCNPESQEYAIQIMNIDGKPKTVGRDVTVGEMLDIIKKDLPYYKRSNGGVTLSGGEFLCQPDFAQALLQACKENGYNTAVETTAFAEKNVISRVIPYTDLFLLDIKHINSSKHKKFTTQSNDKILENAKFIAQNAKELIIRVPVVPGFNDTLEEILSIAKFATSLQGVMKLHLLPYHRLGQDKYKALSREYLLKGIEPPSDEKMKYLLSVAEQSGLECRIGG